MALPVHPTMPQTCIHLSMLTSAGERRSAWIDDGRISIFDEARLSPSTRPWSSKPESPATFHPRSRCQVR
jgi:hypothetical protein